jgi:hypothetical protein
MGKSRRKKQEKQARPVSPAPPSGPVLVPKPEQSPIAPEQETSDQNSFANSGTEPSPTEPAVPSHKLRTILFLLAGLILLALLILLLIRGPVHRDSLPSGAGPIEALIIQCHAPTAVEPKSEARVFHARVVTVALPVFFGVASTLPSSPRANHYLSRASYLR